MSNLPTVVTATLLHCGQCDDYSAPLVVDGPTATCTACGDEKDIAWDIARHLDPTEVAVVTTEGHLGYVDDEDIADAK